VRALLWAVWHTKTAMPTLPVEGRTSIDMEGRDDREFLAAMGYLPLGRHAIRADMLERLAAAGRRAVRESREAHEAYQRAAAAYAAAHAAPAGIEVASADVAAASSSDVVTQGDGALATHSDDAVSIGAGGAPQPEPVEASNDVSIAASPDAELQIVEPSSPVCYAGEVEPIVPMTSSEPIGGSGSDAIGAVSPEPAEAEAPNAPPVDAPATATATPEPPVPPALPPGHFRATPEMMSYVGCSEAEMADILRDLGYRVHPPTEPDGPHSFSLVPRRMRDHRPPRRDEHRTNRPHGERNRNRNQQAPVQQPAEGVAVSPADDAAHAAAQPQEQRQERPREDRPQQERHNRPPRSDKPRGKDDRNQPRQARSDHGSGPKRNEQGRGGDRPRDNRRNDRRDDAGRPERTISTGPAVESPFAKLKDLGLFK
jgi:ATP-dependent RNA helicase SUPV3L1/SUV3